MEPESPALAGRFFTIEPLGKSTPHLFFFFPTEEKLIKLNEGGIGSVLS